MSVCLQSYLHKTLTRMTRVTEKFFIFSQHQFCCNYSLLHQPLFIKDKNISHLHLGEKVQGMIRQTIRRKKNLTHPMEKKKTTMEQTKQDKILNVIKSRCYFDGYSSTLQPSSVCCLLSLENLYQRKFVFIFVKKSIHILD